MKATCGFHASPAIVSFNPLRSMLNTLLQAPVLYFFTRIKKEKYMSDKTLLMRKKNNQLAPLSLNIEEQNSFFKVLQGVSLSS